MRNWNNWNGHKKCGQLSIVGKMFSPRLGRLFAKKAIDEKGQQVRKQGCDWPAIVNCFWQQWPRHQQDGNYFFVGGRDTGSSGGSSLLVVKREICPPSVHWGRKNGKLHLICRKKILRKTKITSSLKWSVQSVCVFFKFTEAKKNCGRPFSFFFFFKCTGHFWNWISLQQITWRRLLNFMV